MTCISLAKRIFLGLTLACAIPALATSTTIDFDDAAATTAFAETTPLRDAYAGVGALFAGVAGIGGSILDQRANFGFDARSGSNFLAFNVPEGLGGPDERVRFASVQDTVSVFGADNSFGLLTLAAFDRNGRLLGSTSLRGGLQWQELSITQAGIASVIFGSTGNFFAFDDLRFSARGSVPEPGSLALFALGLLGAAAARRRAVA